ncbi:protein kinase [Synechococcales cyanobacterium C]|uniref:Protein kinase n=1 Tax=Petrachloros mirabilis ULC683 TaxID=2781853 RepID=A0A8K2A8X0_9CYAN|nr:serine/threonine-protein kinase [Petrachloros mirabilis]NCJ08511.1 protein kinase [Petrachloros mirabilis ULC683]
MLDAHTDPYIGNLLINRYRLIEQIGQGSMGRVYRAEDELLGGVTVAVKFLAQALLNEQMKQRFAHEARTGAQLGQRSLHIVRVLDYGVHRNEVPFYVMEYMQGHNLSDLIAPKPLTVPRFLRLARHICLGMQCAHQGIKVDGQITRIVHRDIKPSNVFVISDPGLGELAKVLDFGIAKFFTDSAESSQTKSFMGTLAYCSPEQIEGKDLDVQADIYSLGITMYELLTGVMPITPEAHSIGSWYKAHRSQTPRPFEEVAPGLALPKDLATLILRCLAKSPSNRPQDMAEVLAVVDDLLVAQQPPTPIDEDVTDDLNSSPPDLDQPQERVSQTTYKATQVPSLPNPQERFWSVEQAGWTVSWPEDKPTAEIVFPQPLRTQHEEAPALWVMLSRSEIQSRLLNTRYNQFLFLPSPHPMVLWITTIYDAIHGPRWMPCYLDLKDPRGQQVVNLLSEMGYYPLLFFALEDSEQPANVMTLPIAAYQRQMFQDWLKMARQSLVVAPATTSKRVLKAEFEKLKPKIMQKLEAAQARNVARLN